MKIDVAPSSAAGQIQGVIVKWPRDQLRINVDVELNGVMKHPDAIRCIPGGEFIEAEYRWSE